MERNPIARRFPAKALLLALGLIGAAGGVFALVDRVVPPPPKQSEPPEKSEPAPKPRKQPLANEAGTSVLGALLPLAGVLTGAVALLFVLKRTLKGNRHLPGNDRVLKVRDVLTMGPKRAIYLIALEDRNLVVGLSGDQLTLLSEYSSEPADAPEAPAVLAAEQELSPPPRTLDAEAVATSSSASALVAAPAGGLDIEIAGDVTVPPVEATQPRRTQGAARPFSFAPAHATQPRSGARADRVPQRFRQLLEQAAAAEEGKR